MSTVFSQDGTVIAFDRSGQGPPLIFVDGALCYRASGPSASLKALLSRHFTVFTYDRRGRGESSDTPPYAIEREIEDLAALLAEAGGRAFVYGVSSGAALALEAAARLPGIVKLALFEAPFFVDDSRAPLTDDYIARMHTALAEGRRADVIRAFMKLVEVPAVFVFLMRFMPVWPRLLGVAHTLPYDTAIMQDTQRGRPLPAGRWSAVTVPTLVLLGGKSPVWMQHAMQALHALLPTSTLRVLPKQTHIIDAKAHVPVLVEFFNN